MATKRRRPYRGLDVLKALPKGWTFTACPEWHKTAGCWQNPSKIICISNWRRGKFSATCDGQFLQSESKSAKAALEALHESLKQKGLQYLSVAKRLARSIGK